MNDELSGWWDTFKLDRGGEQFWLKAWNGKLPYTHARGGRGGSSSTIPRHNIAVVGGTQPATLSTMLEATGGIERGFVSRCLFSYPDRPRHQLSTGRAADNKCAADALERVFALAGKGLSSVPVSDDAGAFHAEWVERFNPDALLVDVTRPEGQWIVKQFGTAIRLSLVLETVWWSTKFRPDEKVLTRANQLVAMTDPTRNDNVNERSNAERKLNELISRYELETDGSWTPPPSAPAIITLRAMQAACDLIENYFYPHFVRCEASAYAPKSLKASKDLVRILVKKQATAFNARRVQKYEEFGKVSPALHGVGSSEVVEDVCEFLEARHIIKRRNTVGVGRKPKDYDVNPLLARLAKRALR